MTGRRGRKRRCHTAAARRPGWRNPPPLPKGQLEDLLPHEFNKHEGRPPGDEAWPAFPGGRGAEPLTRTYRTLTEQSAERLLPAVVPSVPCPGRHSAQERLPSAQSCLSTRVSLRRLAPWPWPQGALPHSTREGGRAPGRESSCNRTSRQEILCFIGGGAVLPGAKMSLSLSTRGTLFHCFQSCQKCTYFILKGPTRGFINPLIICSLFISTF